MKNQVYINHQQGHVLVTLLIIVVTSVIVSTAAVALMVGSTQETLQSQQGQETLLIAEAGLENALIRLLRNPNYTGETLAVGEGTAIVEVSGDQTKTIVSQAQLGNFTRKLEIIATYQDYVLEVISWKEIN